MFRKSLIVLGVISLLVGIFGFVVVIPRAEKRWRNSAATLQSDLIGTLDLNTPEGRRTADSFSERNNRNVDTLIRVGRAKIYGEAGIYSTVGLGLILYAALGMKQKRPLQRRPEIGSVERRWHDPNSSSPSKRH